MSDDECPVQFHAERPRADCLICSLLAENEALRATLQMVDDDLDRGRHYDAVARLRRALEGDDR